MVMCYLVLGDFYMIGEDVVVSGCWLVQLVVVLCDSGIVLDDLYIIVIIGWIIDEFDVGIDVDVLQGLFDLVSLLIGVNDQYCGCSVDDYCLYFIVLLECVLGFVGGCLLCVLVLLILDWGVILYVVVFGCDCVQIGQELDVYNMVVVVICVGYGVIFIDIIDFSCDFGGEVVMLVVDGLYLLVVMYVFWYQCVYLVVWVQLVDEGIY